MLNPYDQQVYDAGFKYIPQSQYLLNPFQIPVAPETSGETVTGGLPAIYQAQGGGGGDMVGGNIRTDFDPRAYNLAMRQGETVGPNPDLFYAPQSKLGALMDFIPGIGTIKRGAEFLRGMMPINERAIMENEARGMGVFTDDIGRVVNMGDYNTPQGIMAGYNLSKIDKGTFDKRRAAIEKGLMQTNPEEAKRRLGLLDEAEDLYLNQLQNRTNIITKYRTDKKAAEAEAKLQEEIRLANLAAAQKAQAAQEAAQRAEAQRMQDRNRQQGTGGYQYGTQGGGGGAGRDFMEGPSGREAYSGDTDLSGTMGSFMDGGLVDLVDIYD